jgi:hypothetical protein
MRSTSRWASYEFLSSSPSRLVRIFYRRRERLSEENKSRKSRLRGAEKKEPKSVIRPRQTRLYMVIIDHQVGIRSCWPLLAGLLGKLALTLKGEAVFRG